MPTIPIYVYVTDEEYSSYVENKRRIQEECKQLVKEIIKGDE